MLKQVLPETMLKVSEYDRDNNTTITHCRPTNDTVKKSHRSLKFTEHQEDNQSKASSPLFLMKMIAKLERTLNTKQGPKAE